MSTTDSASEEFKQLGQHLSLNVIAGTASYLFKSQVLQEHSESGKKFIDQAFPAQRSSLILNWNSADHNIQRSWKFFTWKRASEIYSGPLKVFDTIEPNDIQQGSLGDCYFLSALSALAEYPHRIQRLFDTQEYEPAGAYIVHMCDVGEIKSFVVDDYFPVNTLGKPAFSAGKVEKGVAELWVVLLEKAWAKRFGCYYAISQGVTNDVLRDFTGAPCEDIATENEHLWDELMDADDAKFIITAASGGSTESRDAVNSLGLISLHAYSLIKVREVRTENGKEQLLQIRNPWGSTEWQGDWSDNSPLWTDELKQELGWTSENDGTFWMNLKDFRNYFTSVTICRAHDDFFYRNIQTSQQIGGFKVFQVNLQDAAQLYASVSQIDERRYDPQLGYEYSTVRIIGALKDEETGKLIYLGGRANTSQRDIWEEFQCPRAGTYLFFVEVEWIANWTERYGFSVFASRAMTLTDATDLYPDYISRVYNIESARARVVPRELGSGMHLYSGLRSGTSNDFKFMEGYLYDAFENTTTNFRLKLDIVYRSLKNLELLPPYTSREFRLDLGPGESAIVVKKQIDMLAPQSYSLAMKKQIVLN